MDNTPLITQMYEQGDCDEMYMAGDPSTTTDRPPHTDKLPEKKKRRNEMYMAGHPSTTTDRPPHTDELPETLAGASGHMRIKGIGHVPVIGARGRTRPLRRKGLRR